jgi:undecaprenyl-diphosphatase
MLPVISIDQSVFHAINASLASPLLDAPMRLVSSSRVWYALGLALIAVALARKSVAMLTTMLLAASAIGFTDLACVCAVKPFFGQFHACHVFQFVRHVVRTCSGDFGLPSTHAANGMAAATVLAWMTRGPVRFAAVAAAGLIGLSRIYLGLHFPLDVLSAYVVGAAIGTAVYGFFALLARRQSGAAWEG